MSKYRGWDFTELAETFKIEIPRSNGGTKDWEVIQQWLRKNAWNKKCSIKPNIVKECKKYLRALKREENGYSKPLWIGLLKIKSDETFMKYFILLVGYMWT